ncbi:MAG: acyl-ACP--UDP-N-acetylglucosamine O-acyltransferase, partial [Saprospiraceae bacterium]|nr:acyl-ACP--UDP-N-acetylglucosamine O-acyltransferase [Saprospiraceae bacterium]
MIHPTAIIDPAAELAEEVQVGPYSVIGPDVKIGAGTVIAPHVVINGPTTIGRNNRIFQFASVGEECQDKKYKGEPTRLEIGDDNVIRESVTIHRGTIQDNSLTRIGSRNLLMAYVHVAHDCMVGDDCIFANNASIAGHAHVGNGVILGGMTGVHQFCKIGSYSMTSGCSFVTKDIPAYVMAAGNP